MPLNNQPYLSTLYHQGIYWVPTSQLEKGSNRGSFLQLGYFQAEVLGLLDSIYGARPLVFFFEGRYTTFTATSSDRSTRISNGCFFFWMYISQCCAPLFNFKRFFFGGGKSKDITPPLPPPPKKQGLE